MKIALMVNQNIALGGGFQYELTMVKALNESRCHDNEYNVITSIKKNVSILEKYGIHAEYFHISLRVRLDFFLRANAELLKSVIKNIPFLRTTYLETYLIKRKIDIVYFLSPSPWALLLDSFNFIFTVWDLCHRDHPEFPEVRDNFEFEQREFIFQKALPKAIAVVAESDLGRANIVRRYHVDEYRIIKIPFFVNSIEKPSPCVIKKKYGIPGDFILYPAQFWAHKNHVYIIDALVELKEKYGKTIFAFFPGTDMGNLNYVKEYAKRCTLDGQVVFPGFIPRDEIIACYQQALALVNPTYFGPTNIPPLEAFQNECLVIHPDSQGFREQTREAALYIDYSDPGTLTRLLVALCNNPHSFDECKKKGLELVKAYSKEKAVEEIEKIFAAFKIKIRTWKSL